MLNPNLEEYASQVNKVRVLQRGYFEASARARKSRLPDDFAKSKSLLVESKKEEKALDEMTDNILFWKGVSNA